MKIGIFIGLFLCSIILFAQNNLGSTDDASRIALMPVVSDEVDDMPYSAQSILQNKLTQIVTKNGMAATATAMDKRFIITSNISITSKDITATAPPMYAYALEVTLYVGDGIDDNLFGTLPISLKGVGETPEKAYIAALKTLKADDPRYQTFLDKAKTKIIEYYNSKCDLLLQKANTLAGKGDFDAAIYTLMSVPDACKACYQKATNAVIAIYKKKIDQEGQSLLMKATNAWNATQNDDGASDAASFLEHINPNAACYAEAKKLADKIAKRILELDKRAWNFELKQQQNDVNLEKATIGAIRDVGVAYGNNVKTVYSFHWWQ